MILWQLGNTSVRSAMRIRDGLLAYSQSVIQGDIRSQSGDIKFRDLLGECGIVTLGKDSSNSVGRKWRSAMGKLGFLYPAVKKNMGFTQTDLGPVDTITPAGWNLIRSETVPAMQECFLRAMVTPMEVCGKGKVFSPLCWTLSLMLDLQKSGLTPSFTLTEFALFIQTSTPDDKPAELVESLLNFRTEREDAENKRIFDRKHYEKIARLTGKEAGTIRDYADMNIRYLKATGMVHAYGKGISLVPEKHALAVALTKRTLWKMSPLNRYQELCKGAVLPTDNVLIARQVLMELLEQVKEFNIPYSIEGRKLDNTSEVNQVRYEIEELITDKKEKQYASEQASKWKEITAYMDLISSGKSKFLADELEISIPRSEEPAYFEWVLWRAFLAIDSLVNTPGKVRRFKIDQDFLPVSTAPGNGPDLIAEFEKFVIAVEVTLSENSRQEAMEGEPVRRHIADLMQEYKKPVFGLFIAKHIDTNTAETFRTGIWYTKNDTCLNLQILPLTLNQFNDFFKYSFANDKISPQALIELIETCGNLRKKYEAPAWKKAIEKTMKDFLL